MQKPDKFDPFLAPGRQLMDIVRPISFQFIQCACCGPTDVRYTNFKIDHSASDVFVPLRPNRPSVSRLPLRRRSIATVPVVQPGDYRNQAQAICLR